VCLQLDDRNEVTSCVLEQLVMGSVSTNLLALVLQIISADGDMVALSLEELKSKFPKHTVVTTLQCAGNRRGEMSRVRHVNGLSWGCGAISTAEWSGARLSDVLKLVNAKPSTDAAHVEFVGLDCDITGATIEIATCTIVRLYAVVALCRWKCP
jgi:Oxidoreductase molybdopterin binding domain